MTTTTMIELIVNRKPKRPKFYARCGVDGELFTGYGDNEWMALAEATAKANEWLIQQQSQSRREESLTQPSS